MATVGCASPTRAPEPPRAGAAPRSNILRADYVGSEACAPCHQRIHDTWLRSPMHNMTRLPSGATIRAPFNGATFSFKHDEARFETDGTDRFMRLRSAAFGDHRYRVTKVIGGRVREDFAGVEVTGDGRPLGDPAAELVLPVSYVFETRSFRLKGYSVMVGERPGLRAGGVWNQTCVLCHNTYPLFASLWGALHGPGAPPYQGEVVDRVLPPDRRVRFRISDREALDAAVREEVRFVAGGDAISPPGDSRPLLAEAARVLRERLVPANLVEVGVGCESCHGGSREHTFRTDVHPSFEPRSTFLDWGAGASRAESINRACARCHQVLFSRYPYTWEGGLRRQAPGGSHITSGEARDLLLGSCARQMSCTTCHDPHGADPPGHLAALATPAGNRVCTSCHPALAAPSALRAHAHHDPAGAGGACLSCHMPRKNMGLGYQLTRYHRIGSPTDPARVEGDRPLECALCHPRSTVKELVDAMERFWGKRYDRAKLRELYGDLGAPVLAATLARGKPHEQATAVGALGESGDPQVTAALAPVLFHPYPLVRLYARRALEKLRGAPVPIDVEQDGEDVRMAVSRWLTPGTPLPPRRMSPSPAAATDDED